MDDFRGLINGQLPYSNTGAVNIKNTKEKEHMVMKEMFIEDTNPKALGKGLAVCIDWISFTFEPGKKWSAYKVVTLLGFQPEDFMPLEKGAQGYRSVLVLNNKNLRILYDGQESMGIHVDISGSAIESLLDAWRTKNTVPTPFGAAGVQVRDLRNSLLLDLLESLSKEGVRFTRIDLAVDDIGCSYYSCEDVLERLENQRVISKFRTYNNVSPRLLKDGTRQGHTIYLGSRNSQIMLRIYDKKLETEKKHGSVCAEKWIRWELEVKKDRANQAVNLLLEKHSAAPVVAGILKHYIRFTVSDGE